MKIRFTISCFLLVAFSILVKGQSLESCWDRTYRIGENETVHALVQSVNGWIVIVGEVEQGENGKDGFFLVLDPQTGDQLSRQTYGEDKEDVLLNIRQASDGTFYLIGYSSSKSNGRTDGWLLHVDEKGQVLEEARFGTSQDEKFTHLVLLDGGTLLIAGQKGKKPAGDIWIVRVENGQKASEQFIGEGNFKEVVGAFRSPTGAIWLCGNLLKFEKRTEETGVSWLVELDENGNEIEDSRQILKVDDFGELKGMKESLFNDMILVGSSLNGQQWDTWMVELSEDGEELLNFSYGQKNDEFGIAMLKTVQDHFLLARRVNPYQSQIVVIDGGGGELVHNISKGNDFLIKDIIYTYDRNFIVAGVYQEGRDNFIYITCLQPNNLLAIAKSGPELSCSKPVLRDNTGDGLLARGERGYISFEITNIGETNLTDAYILVKGLPASSNFQKIYISFLQQGSKRTEKIPISGNDFSGASLELTLEVYERSQLLEKFPFVVRSKTVLPPGGNPVYDLEIITNWETLYSTDRSHNNKPARVSSDKIAVDHKALIPNQYKSTDYRVKKNGVWLEDNKAIKWQIDTEDREDSQQYPKVNYLSFEASLDTGMNEIIIEILDKNKVVSRDTLLFEYKPAHPNLHVLVVGPENVGLNYNSQDALDFAGLMAAQATQNYFNKVFIDTLVSSEETTQRNLSIAFDKLTKRFRGSNSNKPNRIATNDVLVVFISSHGLIVEEEGDSRFKIMPSDYDPEHKSITTLDYKKTILGNLQKIDCKKLIFIDACHSAAGGVKKDKVNIAKYLLELNETPPGLLSITSSDTEEFSYENAAWENGAFTKAIEEALKGEGLAKEMGIGEDTEDGNRVISLAALYDYLAVRVPNLVKKIDDRLKQNPRKQSNNKELEAIKFLMIPNGN